MKRTLGGMILLLLTVGSANAALLSRAGGQAYYDDVLNITWLADANAGAGSIYDDGYSATDGRMTWASAQAWMGSMNTANYLGTSTWRLPTIIDTGAPGCNWANTGTDCGWNVDLSSSEMAHMYYSTLGNLAYCTTGGSCPQAGWGLSSTGLFSNLQPDGYWSSTTSVFESTAAWVFGFGTGGQADDDKSALYYAWAVSSGDALVPVPAAVWMFGSALGVLGLVRRKVRIGTV
jgi:hypothetical protein